MDQERFAWGGVWRCWACHGRMSISASSTVVSLPSNIEMIGRDESGPYTDVGTRTTHDAGTCREAEALIARGEATSRDGKGHCRARS
jgi:hypothetical protein